MNSNVAASCFLVLVATLSVLAYFGFGETNLYGIWTFITILAYSVINTYALINPVFADENVIPHKIRNFLELAVRSFALPMYTTQVLQKFGVIQKETGIGDRITIILIVFTVLYKLVSTYLEQGIIDLWTYSNTLGLAMIGHFNHNYYIGAAGGLFALGEYIYGEDKYQFDLTPESLFNIFLAAFTATATVGLLI